MGAPHELAEDLERRLRERRRDLTLELHEREGPFWENVRDLRARWRVHPLDVVPPDTMGRWMAVSFHYRLACLPAPEQLGAPGTDGLALYAATLGRLGDWLRDIRSLYERTIPAEERRYDVAFPGSFEDYCRLPDFQTRQTGGDLFTDHWAPFLSGCVLYQPPDDALERFADHVTFDPNSLVESLRDRPPDAAARIAPPGMEYVEDPAAAVAAEWRYWGLVFRELAARLGPRGIDLWAEVDNVRHDPRFIEAWLAQRPRVPARPYIDPAAPVSEEVVRRVRRLAATPRPRGRPRIHPLEAAQVTALKRQGLTEGEIADQLGLERTPDSYDKLQRSNKVKIRSARDRARRKKPEE